MQSSEAPLAYLGFRLLSPGPSLRPYIRSYWQLRRQLSPLEYHQEYMNPTGGFGMVFNFGDPLHLDGVPVGEPVFLDGANTVSRKVGLQGRVELVGVRFYEGGAYPFLGPPLHDLRNETALLGALDRPGLLRLHAQLLEAGSTEARIRRLEGWLLNRLTLGRSPNPLIPISLARLRQDAGRLPIPELARELAVSQRHLERLYQSQVGMSPKQFAQLQRVEAARLALKRWRGLSTSRLAADLGFYDQSHFIREFRSVIGITPFAYLKQTRRRRSGWAGAARGAL